MEEEIDSMVYSQLQGMISINGPQVANLAFQILSKVLGNLAENPTEPKFRVLNKANKVIIARFLPCRGILDLLTSLGFIEEDANTLRYSDEDTSKIEISSIILSTVIMELKEQLMTPEEKQRLVIFIQERQREMKSRQRELEEEKNNLLRQTQYDRQEIANRKPVNSRSLFSSSGGGVSTFSSIGVDVNRKKG